MTEDSAMDAAKPFRFMDLSAELRNRIYDYATDDGHSELGFLHLTQVCQQIRTEFRPIYMTKTLVRLAGEELDPYLFAYLPDWDEDSTQKDKLAASIEITNVDAWVHHTMKSGICLDPYMRLLVASPNVQITIGDIEMSSEGHQIQRLFQHQNKWAQLADDTVEDIHLITSTEFCMDYEDELNEFCVRLKPGFDAPWVEYHEDGAVIVDDAGPVEFLQNLGFLRDEDYSVWLILQHEEYDESPKRILGF